MLKKMKRVAVDSSPSYPFDEEARSRFKHQSLVQDYQELHKETDAMKKKLQRAKQRKLTLLAEVRFLRRRYKYLKKTQSPKTPSERDPTRSQVPEIHREALTREVALPVLDLNQISNGEEVEFQVGWEPLKLEKKKRKKFLTSETDEQQQPSDLKLSVCREMGNGSNRTGKRKISWQDPVALRV